MNTVPLTKPAINTLLAHQFCTGCRRIFQLYLFSGLTCPICHRGTIKNMSTAETKQITIDKPNKRGIHYDLKTW